MVGVEGVWAGREPVVLPSLGRPESVAVAPSPTRPRTLTGVVVPVARPSVEAPPAQETRENPRRPVPVVTLDHDPTRAAVVVRTGSTVVPEGPTTVEVVGRVTEVASVDPESVHVGVPPPRVAPGPRHPVVVPPPRARRTGKSLGRPTAESTVEGGRPAAPVGASRGTRGKEGVEGGVASGAPLARPVFGALDPGPRPRVAPRPPALARRPRVDDTRTVAVPVTLLEVSGARRAESPADADHEERRLPGPAERQVGQPGAAVDVRHRRPDNL